MFTTLTEGIEFIKKQVLTHATPESKLYVPVGGKRTTSPEEPPFDLLEAVREFLVFEEQTSDSIVAGHSAEAKESAKAKVIAKGDYRKVLLLRGDAGSGKSSFCQHLQTELWKDYREGQAIPFFISLPLLKDPIHHAIEETLTQYGFSQEQITTLKKSHRFIFILDGYDELHQFKNLYMSNKLYEWQAKVIITCRSQALYHIEDVDKYFIPFEGEKRQPWLLREYYVAPFSEEQIESYIKLYEAARATTKTKSTESTDLKEITVELVPCHEVDSQVRLTSTEFKKASATTAVQKSVKSADVKEASREAKEQKEKKDEKDTKDKISILSPTYQQLQSIPGLEKLIKTPFLLHLALEALPEVLAKHQEKGDQDWQCTQAILYDLFVVSWFKRQEDKLKASQHIKETSEDIKPKFWQFCKSLALKMREQEVTYITYECTQRSSDLFEAPESSAVKNPWDKFFKADKQQDIIRSACPLQEYGKGVYGFFHASMIEYFATRAMYEELIARPQVSCPLSSSKVVVSITPAARRDSLFAEYEEEEKKENPLFPEESSSDPKTLTKPQGHLHIKSFTRDLTAVSFLADRLAPGEEARDHFKATLFQTLEISKQAENYAIGAANAITILNFARIQFSGMDFRGIRIPDADLSYGVFDSTQFQAETTDLSNVTFTGAWLRRANLNGANLSGIKFGEWPYIEFERFVIECVFSPDGCWLAVGCDDNKIYLYDAVTWKWVRTFEGHIGEVNCIVFDSKGERLASGSSDNTVSLWEVATGRLLRPFEENTEVVTAFDIAFKGHAKYVTKNVMSVAFGAKDETLVSGGSDHTIRLWEVASGRMLRILEGHTSAVTRVAFNVKGERLASASYDKTVRLWEVVSGRLLHTFEGHMDDVMSVAFDAMGERLVSGSKDKTVRLWDVASGRLLRTLEGHTDKVGSVAFDPKGEKLASGSSDNTIRLWEAASGQLLCILEGHTKWVMSVAFDAKGERLASGSWDRTVRLWEVSSARLPPSEGHVDKVKSVAFDAKGKILASGSEDNTIRLWEVATGRLLRTLESRQRRFTRVGFDTGWITSVAFDTRGERLASGSWETVCLWEVVSGRLLLTLKGHRGWVVSVAFDAKGERLASGSHDRTVRLWEAETGQLLRTLEGHRKSVTSVVFDAEGEMLASGSEDKTVRLWEAASGRLLRILKGNMYYVTSVAFDTKAEKLASGSENGNVYLWEIANGRLLRTLESHARSYERRIRRYERRITNVAFDTRGERLASGSEDNTVRLWDVQSGQCFYVLQGFISFVNSVAWRENQGGSFLVTGNGDKAVRCWQVIEKEKGRLQVLLRWTSHQAALTLTEAYVEGVKGLDTTNAELLQQRGAVGKHREDKEEKSSPSINATNKKYNPRFFSSELQEPLLDSASEEPISKSTPGCSCCVIM